MKKFWRFGLNTGLAAVLLAGCGGEDVSNEEQQTETPDEAPAEVAEADFPVTLTDALGDEVVIEEEPQSIVSMVPSTTEISYELGLGDKMVGLSDFDNYPAETADVEKIGGQEFNVEKVISLEPDLVISHESGISTWEGGLQQLRDAGITVYVVNNETSFEEVYDSITVIGQATGTVEEADALIAEMQEQVDEITEQAAAVEEAKTVFVEVGSQPDIYTTGSGTFIDEMLSMINAENLAGDQEGWVSMDPEAIVNGNPDVIVTTEGSYNPEAVDQIKQRGGFAEVTAVEEDAVFNINTDAVTRSGPRLTEGLLELAQAVYPEVFSE
ncbi:ABC transporter substrate-binding protein [Planococcus sp. X10-3]|uniref:ABC transporter substrate-binding protein n=1 Tax=Planococcus sp. X10-3 TaxID=3061240 RepID=UPI003BAE4717